MFPKADKERDKERIVPAAKSSMPSIISTDLKITGNLASDGDIQLDGSVEGNVKSQLLTVGETANVKGEVTAESVEVKGTVTGQIRARSVSLAKTARVTGDIEYEALAIEAGAWLDGHCKHLDQGAAEAKVDSVAKEVETAAKESDIADTPAPSAEPGQDWGAPKPGQPRVRRLFKAGLSK